MNPGTLVLVMALLTALPLSQAGLPQVKMEEDDRLITRYGPVILEKSEDEKERRWRIRFNDRRLWETEDDELGLWELFEGDNGHDYVIAQSSSGGIACPYQFRVIETGPKALVRLSGEFGSCLEPSKTRLSSDALVLEMPSHIPHPDLLTAAEIRRRNQTVEIYTVRNGRVTKREEVRK